MRCSTLIIQEQMSSNISTKVKKSVTLYEMRTDSRRFPRLVSMPSAAAIEQLARIVATAFMYNGKATDENNVIFIATSLYNEMMTDEYSLGMKYISMAEVEYVIKKSLLGQGTELFGISVVSLYKAIAEYCKGEGHIAEKEQPAARQVIAAPPVKDMIDVFAKAMVNNQK